MGTWNTKPFGNDKACDWLGNLEKAKDESVFHAALGVDGDGDVAIAAAAIIAAARSPSIGKLPPKAKAWVSERGFVPSDALVKQAITTIEKIKAQSELRELWAESNSLTKWLEQMDSLLAGLREVQSLPPAVRKPKAPPAPRLLEKIVEKINPDEESPLRETLRNKLEAITDLEAPLTRTLFPESPLILLAKHGLLPEAKRLVERGARINPVRKVNRIHSPRHSPLEAACKSGRAEMAKWLLEQGAKISPNAFNGAVSSGSIATIKILLKHSARLIEDWAKKYGENDRLKAQGMAIEYSEEYDEYDKLKVSRDMLLHKAVDAKYPPVLEFLAKNGCHLETRNSLGMTPLIWAAMKVPSKDWKETVEVLLSLGADPNAKDRDGFTALDLVSSPDVADLIKECGGRSGKEIPDYRP